MNPSLETALSAATGWLEADPDAETRRELERLLNSVRAGDGAAAELLVHRFTGRLAFGTAGIRGPIGFGPQAMNRMVVSYTTAGLAKYLLSQSASANGLFRVLVGHDARKNSEVFARDAAEVLSGHGIEVLLTRHYVPTPIVAFGVRYFVCDAAIMVTASHNPATDNGYKVYFGGENGGSQIIPPDDRGIETKVQDVSENTSWSDIPRSSDLISGIGNEIFGEYISATLNSLHLPAPTNGGMSVVYTAMHGVGGEIFLAAMANAGFTEPCVVEQQFSPDPDFPTVPFPNPEEDGALELSFEKGRSVGADLIIAHDPDADRLAVALPDSSEPGRYKALTGNQIGAILGWHLGDKARASGRSGTLANSIVSSPVLGKIAQHFGLKHEETLTGFKYISRVKNLIFGFEEALGYLVTPEVVRDKDGISAGLLMVSVAENLAIEGKTLRDYLGEIQNEVGAFDSGQITLHLKAAAPGSTVTSALREEELTAIGPRVIKKCDDFQGGVGAFPKADLLRFFLDDGSRVIARPSGTEPKVKIYVDTEGAHSVEARERLLQVVADLRKLLQNLDLNTKSSSELESHPSIF